MGFEWLANDILNEPWGFYYASHFVYNPRLYYHRLAEYVGGAS